MMKKPSKQKSRSRSGPKRENEPAVAEAVSAEEDGSINALLESLTFRWRADGLSAEALKQVFGPTPPIQVVRAAALLRRAYQAIGYDLFVTLVPLKRTPPAMQKDRTGLAQLIAAARRHLATERRAVSLLIKVAPEILTAAIGCFESHEAAARFLVCPSPSLGDRIPAEVALTLHGKTELLHLLGRIEHGVFA